MGNYKSASAARIDAVDALRGFALLGLLLVHACDYFEIYWAGPAHDPLHALVISLFAGKAFAIFALLFGLSFFIIMDRARQRGSDFSGRFVWRLVILFAAGSLHAAVFVGDILQILAVAGLVLVALNRLQTRWLLALAVFCLVEPVLLFGLLHAPGGLAAQGQPLYWSDIYRQTFAHGTFGQVTALNLGDGLTRKLEIMWDSGRVAQVLGMSLLGIVLGRVDFFRHPEGFLRLRRFGLAGALVAVPALHFVASALAARIHPAEPSLLDTLFRSYSALAITAVWIFGFIELYSWAWPRDLLRLLAPAGRMSLTLYVAQSLICVPLFYGYGLGLSGHVNQETAFAIGIGVFAAEVAFAHIWFRFFLYGPFEWLWRAATWMSLKVPFKRSVAVEA